MSTYKIKHKKQKYKDFAYNPKILKEARRLRRISNQLHKRRKDLLKK